MIQAQYSAECGPSSFSFSHHQTLKNALSPYKLGGAAGGSDYDPKGKSDSEIMRFCQSFMNEIYRYLGSDKYLPSEELVLAPARWDFSLGNIDVLLVIFREVLRGQGYFCLVLAFELKLLAMGWFSLPSLFLQNADMNKELKGLRVKRIFGG
ncbi:uncharacterized protein LOC116115794 [Pistacia vera]|uniref:uncharacterized protein LOC116115794 n=1 Tax=Pistacia vera TaxID=55513 RepID=UPI00126395A8|nr:uncharacterized protein LOC116115794 [Pistacia vera]